MTLKTRLILIWSGFLLLSCMLGWKLWSDYQEAEKRMFLSMRNHAALLAEHAHGSFKASDLALQGVVNDPRFRRFLAEKATRYDVGNKAALTEILAAYVRTLAGAVNFFVADTDGKVLLAAVGVPEGTSIADRDYFRQLSIMPSGDSVISETVKGRGSERWSLQVVRRLVNEKGEFLGVVGVSLGIEEQFSRFYGSIDWPEGTAISLWNQQQRLLMRYPMLPDQIGRRSTGNLLDAAGNFPASDKVEVGPSEFDGRIRARSLHKLEHYPVAAIVAVPREHYFADWRSTLMGFGIAGSVGLIAVSLMTIFLRRQRRNEELLAQERRRYGEQLESYGKIVRSTPTALALLSPHLACIIANPAIAALLDKSVESERLMGKPIIDLFPESVRRPMLTEIQASLEGEHRKAKIEMEGVGGSRHYIVETSPFSSGGVVTAVVVSLRDITVQCLAESALQQREEELKAIFDCEPDCVKVFGLDGRLRKINPAGIAALEADNLNHALSIRVADLIVDEDRTAYRSFLARVIEGESGILQYRGVGLKGSPRHVETHAAPLRDADGEIVGVLAISRDISRQKATEEYLRLPALAIEQSPNGMMITNTKPEIEYVNRAFSEITGYRLDELLGKNPNLLNSGQTPPETFAGLWQSLAAGEVWRGEFFNQTKSGRHYISQEIITPVRATDGQVEHYLAIMEDVTKLRETEEKLRNYQENLEQIVRDRTAELDSLYNQAPCGYLSFDAEWRVTAINDTALGFLGYQRSEVTSLRTAFDLLASYEVDKCQVCREELVRMGMVRDHEYDFLCKDGSIFPALMSAEIVHDRNGEFQAVRATFNDNRARQAKERQHNLLNRELQQQANEAILASDAKSSFLANMSHEIRTPLNAIIGMSHLLRKTSLSEKQSDQLMKIETAGEHLLKVISDILDISKIEAGKLTLEHVIIAPNDLLPCIASLIEQRVVDKGLRLITDAQTIPYLLKGDLTRLRQALLNLANNAVKFTDRGAVTLRMRVLQVAESRVCLQFEVEDTGCGIPASVLPSLFSAFQQADESIARTRGGTGLGLVITRQLAEMMGGGTGASSVEGSGSRFWFTVWLDKSTQVVEGKRNDSHWRDMPAKQVDMAGLAGRRLLLVDDEPIDQEIVREILEDAGFVVDVVNNGTEAVEAVRHDDYSLILMDMQMPVMDGLAATSHLRAQTNILTMPIIAMTVNAFAEDRAQCLEVGMNDFLAKPVDPDVLVSTVVRWILRAESIEPITFSI